jgi:hypothetical protein
MTTKLAALFILCVVLSACGLFQPPDTEKPELALNGEASRLTTNTQVTLEGNLASDVVKFIYRLNGSEPNDVTASVTNGVFKVVLDLPAGTNTVVFEASDAAGNVTVSEPITLVVVDLNGVWGSLDTRFSFCDAAENDDVLVLSLEQTPSGITGTVTTGFGGDYKRGTLTGQVNENNVLEAQVSFPSLIEGIPSATGTLRFEVAADTLTGELNYQDGQTCSENDETPATTVVSGTLVKGVGVPPLPSDDALEPNDTQASATPARLPYQSPSDLVLLRNNTDWYRLELSAPSVLTLNVTTTQRLAGFTLRLYGATGLLDEPRFAYNVPQYQTAWGLGAGTYWLEVVGSPFFKEAAMPYGVSLSARPTPDALFEPNDTPADAHVIPSLPFRDSVYLQVDDVDWFRFTLLAPPARQMNVLSFTGIVIPGLTLYSAKTDAQGRVIPDAELCKDDDFSFDIRNLAAGTYYLRVQELGSGDPITFTLAFSNKLVPETQPRPQPCQ